MKRRYRIMRWMSLVGGGAILLQMPTCTDIVTAASSVVTAGGVAFLVGRVITE